MDKKRQFIQETYTTDCGLITIGEIKVSRKFLHQATLCLSNPDSIGSIEWLIKDCEMGYEEAYAIIKKYKEMDYFDFQCNDKMNQSFLDEKIKLIISIALKMEQTYDKFIALKYSDKTRTM